ncbi:MAG: hypothetical protein AB7N65_12930 [Vicinamibacterales bacterium]
MHPYPHGCCEHGDPINACREGCYERAKAATLAAVPWIAVALIAALLLWLFPRAFDLQHAMDLERARPQIERLRTVLESPTDRQ